MSVTVGSTVATRKWTAGRLNYPQFSQQSAFFASFPVDPLVAVQSVEFPRWTRTGEFAFKWIFSQHLWLREQPCCLTGCQAKWLVAPCIDFPPEPYFAAATTQIVKLRRFFAAAQLYRDNDCCSCYCFKARRRGVLACDTIMWGYWGRSYYCSLQGAKQLACHLLCQKQSTLTSVKRRPPKVARPCFWWKRPCSLIDYLIIDAAIVAFLEFDRNLEFLPVSRGFLLLICLNNCCFKRIGNYAFSVTGTY